MMFNKSGFSVHHPKLGEVAPRFALFSTEDRPKIKYAPVRKYCRFQIKLAGLSKVSRLAEIIYGKKRGGAFAGGRRQNGRVYLDETVFVQMRINCIDNGVANTL